MNNNFQYQGERFADIQMLRYQLPGFEALSLNQKLYIYYLSEATLWGRDITFDQFGKYNLLIRSTLERIYTTHKNGLTGTPEFDNLTEYLKRVWFSNGIYHHYGCEKFKPEFSQTFFEDIARKTLGDDAEEILKQITPIIFNPNILPKRVNKANNEDLIKTSACNYYENVSQQEVEDYYSTLSDKNDPEPPSYGLNSTLIKDADGSLHEEVWRIGGKYSEIIEHIVENLSKASEYAENDRQRKIIALLIEYYKTGDLRLFDRYSIEWLKELEGNIDFINGFIEVYGDPLGIKASWEGIVEYKDLEACHRTQTICQNAQWFEDHSPVDPRFRKKTVKGVTANVICAAMLGGDEYPSTAIGINLPNADWIRAQYGSKSITISNITHAYNEASKGNGFLDEFAIDKETVAMVRKYGDRCDDLHTDLHECLGHGSGQLLPGTDPNALKNYSSTIEEARADLFGLYYIADPKLVELNLLDDAEAYKSQYYTYLMNGLLTQSVRIKLGDNIEEAHMRNRALIANWAYAHADGAMELVKRTEGNSTKTYLKINAYSRLRELFATLLAEIQRIKSEGDLEAARNIVETYGVKLNPELHKDILDRYEHLNIAPYKGFLNPKFTLVKDGDTIKDVAVSYDEALDEQMLRYSREYRPSKSPLKGDSSAQTSPFKGERGGLEARLKHIKQSFRLLMNGVTAQSLRDKGLEYHLNWGANLLHLKEMAEPYGKDYNLAIALWKEDIRECKILATLIMPAEKLESDLATLWIEQVRSQEIAELLVMNLLQYVNYASDMAFQLLAEQATLPRLIGFNILSRLFSRNMSPNERDINEFIDQAITALKDESLSLRHAALNSVQRFATLGEMHETIARGALKPLEMDYLV